MSFTCLSCLTAMPKTPSTVSNKNDENRYPDLMGNVFTPFTIKYHISYRYFGQVFFIKLKFPFIPNLLRVFINIRFCQMLFLHHFL